MWRLCRTVAAATAFSLPVSVALLDTCGFVAKVEGVSMQVGDEVMADELKMMQMSYHNNCNLDIFVR